MTRITLCFTVCLLLASLSGCNTAPGPAAPGSGPAAGNLSNAVIEHGEGPAATRDEVIGKRWQWVRTITPVERIDVSAPDRYTLRLTAEGRAEIQFDCNRGGGNFTIEGNQISFGPLMSTRMACAENSQDVVYMQELGQVTSFFVDQGVLYLEMPMDSGTMRFESADASKNPQE